MRRVSVPAVWLAGNTTPTSEEGLAAKVFFQLGDDVAELYVNWNPKPARLEIVEKDEEYRQAVMRALTAP